MSVWLMWLMVTEVRKNNNGGINVEVPQNLAQDLYLLQRVQNNVTRVDLTPILTLILTTLQATNKTSDPQLCRANNNNYVRLRH